MKKIPTLIMMNKSKVEYKCNTCKDLGYIFYGGFTYECNCREKYNKKAKTINFCEANIRGIW